MKMQIYLYKISNVKKSKYFAGLHCVRGDRLCTARWNASLDATDFRFVTLVEIREIGIVARLRRLPALF